MGINLQTATRAQMGAEYRDTINTIERLKFDRANLILDERGRQVYTEMIVEAEELAEEIVEAVKNK